MNQNRLRLFDIVAEAMKARSGSVEADRRLTLICAERTMAPLATAIARAS